MARSFRFQRLSAAALAAALAGPALAAGLPDACGALRSIDTTAYVGANPAYAVRVDKTENDVRLTMCVASDKKDGRQITLLMRSTAKVPKEGAAEQRQAYVDGLAQQLGKAVKPEDVKIGEAAIWYADFGQLTFWTDKGRLMMTLAAPGKGGKEKAEDIARKLVAAGH